MGQATKDTVIYLYYPSTSKHLKAARESLLPRTDLEVYLNPKTSHSLGSAQKTLDSYFTA
jgi:hypothetical protein